MGVDRDRLTVGMEDARHEFDGGGLIRVLLGEIHRQFEGTCAY
jgi:hypothetical protein